MLRDSINNLVEVTHGASKEAGWWNGLDPAKDINLVPAKLCLIHSEVSEAIEGYRKNLMDDKLPHRPMIEVELADAVIRIGDLCGALGLDLGGAIEEKMAYNAIRPDRGLLSRAVEINAAALRASRGARRAELRCAGTRAVDATACSPADQTNVQFLCGLCRLVRRVY